MKRFFCSIKASFLPEFNIQIPAATFGFLCIVNAVILSKCQTYFISVSQVRIIEGFTQFISWILIPFILWFVGFFVFIGAIFGFTIRSGLVLRIGRFSAIITMMNVALQWFMSYWETSAKAGYDRINNPNDTGVAFRYFLIDCQSFAISFAVLSMVLVVYFAMKTSRMMNLYGDQGKSTGDDFFEGLRIWGVDPRYRRSWVSSVIFHFLVLFGPLFLVLRGCVEPYEPPPGRGENAVPVAVTKVIKKKQKKMIFNPNSAIALRTATIEDSTVMEEVNEKTEKTHSRLTGKKGSLGVGGPGDGGYGGEPWGKMRFIRLKFNCIGWDDGIDSNKGGFADRSMLQWIKKNGGIKQVADKGEAIDYVQLDRMPTGGKPPFIFMTGEAGFSLSDPERRVLREYCLQHGGMIFGDAGCSAFGGCFRAEMNAIFGANRLQVISDDDSIFKAPFYFPHGIDPLTAHDGSKALGIKEKGRWIVFYHPGDLNDGWKVVPEYRIALVDQCFMIGLNVIHYAHVQWYDIARKLRKK